MLSNFWESLDELLTGRAYLPIYAILQSQQTDSPIPPPIIPKNYWE